MPHESIMTDKRDIDGFTAWQLIIKSQERRSKQPIAEAQTAEDKPKSSKWWLVGIGLIASYFSIHVLVAIVRAVLR